MGRPHCSEESRASAEQIKRNYSTPSKVIILVDVNRHKGKNLAPRIIQRTKSADNVRESLLVTMIKLNQRTLTQRTQVVMMTHGDICMPLNQ